MKASIKEISEYHRKYIEENTNHCDEILQPQEEAILSEAFERLDKNNVDCILLYGSRADGRNEDGSDVDVVIVTRENPKDHMVFYKNGLRYSFVLLPRSYFSEEEFTTEVRYYYGAKPIYDPQGNGRIAAKKNRAVCEKLQSLFEAPG